MKNLVEKLKKFWRGLQRELMGESNRIVVPMTMGHVPAAVMTSASVPNPDNRLQYEDSKVTLEGAHRDVHRVRCLDNMIGSLSLSFNEKSREKIALHIADVAESLKRVRAYKTTEDKKQLPVDCLVYSSNGAAVATIKLS